MNFLSINIRGAGITEKHTWVRGLRIVNRVSVLALQETQLSSITGVNFSSFWGHSEREIEAIEAAGRSGGLVTIWDPKVFNKVSCVKNQNFLLISGFLREDGTKLNILNLYAPHRPAVKRSLWAVLLDLIENRQGMWCILGDFNAVRFIEERKNSFFDRTVAEDLNEFIEAACLQEYAMKGKKFTCLTKKGSKFRLSKIDRACV